MLTSLISLAGAVALLLWGIYMVKTGILRTFGDRLREWLARRLTNRFGGFAAGAGLAVMLQSSTATALLISGLQGKGLVTTLVALAAVLGADLGSAFVVQLLSFDLTMLTPVLILIGTALFLMHPDRKSGQFGRILLGLAFILSAIAAIRAATAPLRGDEAAAVLTALSVRVSLCVLVGILLALLSFSSLAAVMITAGIVASGNLEQTASYWCVLGANLGSAILALLTSWKSSVVVRRAPTGNCMMRCAGFLLGAAFLALCPAVTTLFPEGPQGTVYFHLIFNASVGVIGLFFLRPMAHIIDRILPDNAAIPDTEVRPIGNEDMLTPDMALNALLAEIAKSAQLLVIAWNAAAATLSRNLPQGVLLEITDQFKSVLRRGLTIDYYLDLLVRRGLSLESQEKWKRVDEAGDVLNLIAQISAKMVDMLAKHKCGKDRFFSPEGETELKEMHKRVAEQIKRFKCLLEASPNERPAIAQTIIEAQEINAAQNFALIARHMQRLSEGRARSIETSTLHIELLSIFRRIEGILSSAAMNIPPKVSEPR